MRRIIPTVVILLLIAACGGPAATGGASGDADLMGLDDEAGEPVWRGWSAVEGEAVPEELGDAVAAFDYWQIDDEERYEETWVGASTLLDYLRRDELSEKQRAGATALLQALDSEEARMDVTFVVGEEGDGSEGLVVRLYRELDDPGAVPTLAVFVERDEGTLDGFDRLHLWANPGFEEADAFSVALDGEGGWRARRAAGLVYPVGAEAEPVLDEEVADLVAEIADERLWGPFTGPGFVEARSRVEPDEEAELPAPLAPAVGLEERDRRIEEVFEETAFPPRMDSNPFE